MLCKECNEKPILVKKRELCSRCYQKWRKEQFPFNSFKFPKSDFRKRVTVAKNLKRKYGSEIFRDLNKLDHVHYWNLSSMAEKYGVSRERVRQWYTKIKQRKFRPIRTTKSAQRRFELTCTYDPRRKAADYEDGSLAQKGAITERYFMEQCIAREFDVSPPNNRKVDLIVNGFLVDVKGAYTLTSMSPRAKIQYYRYSIKGEQIFKANFFACYHPTEDSFFIIPNSEIKINADGTAGIYISEKKTDYSNSKNRYWEYKDAWDLLEYRSVADFYN